MDARIRNAVLAKIRETVSNSDEVVRIKLCLGRMPHSDQVDFALGIAIGRIYNSFHYQTRRTLKRNATEAEFAEFLDILADKANEIKKALEQGKQQ
jgi:hypothetical protein